MIFLLIFFQMSDVSVALDSLKISDNDDIPEFEESEIAPEDSASTAPSTASTKEALTHLLTMSMKKIEVLETKLEEMAEKLAACGGGSPLKRKKKEGEFNAATWSARITKTGYFKVGHNKSAFHTNAARFAYINILMEHYKTSDFSKYTLDEVFEKDDDGDYPIFQALLDARPVPHDFEECNLTGKNKLTSDFIKVAAAPPPMAAMSMAAM
jgi:hypothetical protein